MRLPLSRSANFCILTPLIHLHIVRTARKFPANSLLRIQSCADWIGAYLISVFTHLSGVKMRPSTSCFVTFLVAVGMLVPIANAQNHAYNSVPIRNSNSPYIVEDYVGSISL